MNVKPGIKKKEPLRFKTFVLSVISHNFLLIHDAGRFSHIHGDSTNSVDSNVICSVSQLPYKTILYNAYA